jgi:hypothetical protein
MAKQKKMLPARKQRDGSREDESVLVRSAESLGRMIGSLQRQLDGATKRLSETADDVVEMMPDIPSGGGKSSRKRATGKKKTKPATARKRTARQGASASRKSSPSRARSAAKKSSKKR